MLPTLKYQLITLGPNAGRFEEHTRKDLSEGFRELNLDPKTQLAVLGVDDRDRLDGKSSLVGLWYGGKSPYQGEAEHMEALHSLLDMGAAIYPLVESLNDFAANIPAELQSVNGLEWSDSRLAGDVLRAFGLTRDLRQAFISYKRTDSATIANQLAHALFDRGYQIFLDTASIERGAPFQDVLHERLANIDLIVLLDSPHALDSKWVHEELDLVNQLGLGVLQLVWTDVDPTSTTGYKLKAFPGTEFSIRFPLEQNHFADPAKPLGHDAALKPEVLKQIADRAEQARLRSLGARRMRVVSYIRAEAERLNLEVNVQPGGKVEILRGDAVVSTAYPIIGLPDAWVIYEQERKLTATAAGATVVSDFSVYRILYDGLGILKDRLEHLNWLNDHLLLKTLRTELLHDWLKSHE